MYTNGIPPTLISTLANAKHIVVLTGSGVSAESGVPTFRDAQTSLWEKFRPEDLATPEAFSRNPGLVWQWYAWRRELVAEAKPNPGHTALAQLESRAKKLTLVTQNVDGLHQRAGSRVVLEFHGNITRNRCFSENVPIDGAALSQPDDDMPPICPRCGGWIRPDVVWFGEAIPLSVLEQAFQAASNCDVFLSAGTSLLVYPPRVWRTPRNQQALP